MELSLAVFLASKLPKPCACTEIRLYIVLVLLLSVSLHACLSDVRRGRGKKRENRITTPSSPHNFLSGIPLGMPSLVKEILIPRGRVLDLTDGGAGQEQFMHGIIRIYYYCSSTSASTPSFQPHWLIGVAVVVVVIVDVPFSIATFSDIYVYLESGWAGEFKTGVTRF